MKNHSNGGPSMKDLSTIHFIPIRIPSTFYVRSNYTYNV